MNTRYLLWRMTYTNGLVAVCCCIWIMQELAERTKDASFLHDTLDSTFVFYDLTKAQLSIYQVKPPSACSFCYCSYWSVWRRLSAHNVSLKAMSGISVQI